MKLRYECGALADLDEIFAYVAANSREGAGHLVARIEDTDTEATGEGKNRSNTLPNHYSNGRPK
jgi:hypothetical protein